MSNKRKRRQKSDLLDTAERRAFVFERRLAGMPYRVVAEETVKKFGIERLPSGWNDLYAAKDIGRELDRLRQEIAESAVLLRQMQDERLSEMLTAMWPQAMRGHQGAVDRALRIMDRRAKLWGLDAPTKVAPTTPDGKKPYEPLNLENLTDAELERLGRIFAKIES